MSPTIASNIGEGDLSREGDHCTQGPGRWGSEVFSLAMLTLLHASCALITTADIAIVKLLLAFYTIIWVAFLTLLLVPTIFIF